MSLQLITPQNSEYETARLSWNLAADQRPEAVCLAHSVADVQAAIRRARDEGWRVASQTTGHGAGGLPSLENTLLLKTRLHDGRVDFDQESGAIGFRTGAIWDDIVGKVSARGLTVMHGSSPSVSPAGYLLGGGLSFYGRAYGFATNHVRRFEVVTGDGEFRTASADENPDLFWGLRGGGGIFGTVTGIEIGTLPFAEVFAGATFWPVDAAPELLDAWRSWTREAPESVTTTFRILRLPPIEEVPEPLRGVPVVCIDGVALEDEAGEDLAALLDRQSPPLMGGWGVQPSAAVARLHGDPEDPLPGMGDGILLEDLTDGAAAAYLDAAGPASGSDLVVAELRHLGGAIGRPAEGGGVLDRAEGDFLLYGVGIADPSSTAKNDADLDRLLNPARPHMAPRLFGNFVDRGCTLADCFAPPAVEKLRSLRGEYDPDGIFTVPVPLD